MVADGFQLDPKQPCSGGDVQGALLCSNSEAAVRRQIRCGNVGNFFAVRIEDNNPKTIGASHSRINVTLGIDGHSIGAELVSEIMDDASFTEPTVLLDRKGIQRHASFQIRLIGFVDIRRSIIRFGDVQRVFASGERITPFGLVIVLVTRAICLDSGIKSDRHSSSRVQSVRDRHSEDH